jgi:GNAT superfamily N-acetyltransferase
MKYTVDDFRDLELIDLRTHKDESLLYEFYETVYKSAFPIETQREDPSIWTGRLWGTGSGDTTFELHALIIGRNISDATRRIIYGGSLFEYYDKSQSGLLTYMVVVPEARRKGLGTLLYRRTLDAIRNIAATRGVELSAIYGEVGNPLRPASIDSMDRWDRLRIMQQWGGQVLDMRYIQPALMPGQGPSHDLLLLHFPHDGGQPASLRTRLVLNFLEEFYMNLSTTDLASNENFNEILNSVSDDMIKLVTMIPEQPVLEFPDYGIALHFIKANEHYENQQDSLKESPRPTSNVFESFEHDLVSYSFRRSRPFHSIPLEPSCECEVEVVFPRCLDFISEGRSWRLCIRDADSDSRRVWMRIVPSKTAFSTGINVHNMVLTSCNSHHRACLNEYDIIKLVKLYAPSEEVDIAGQLRISLEGNDMNLPTFLDRIFGPSVLTADNLRAGTLQLLSGEERSEEWRQVFRLGELLNSGRSQAIAAIDDLIQNKARTAKQLMAINGILAGIFDFYRADAEEIADVFQSVYEGPEQLVYLHKGNILHISPRDRPFELAECRSYIGISPYLILPQIVLLYNEELLNTAGETVPDHSVRDIRKLEAARAKIDKVLNT